jgi:hypothetical protein
LDVFECSDDFRGGSWCLLAGLAVGCWPAGRYDDTMDRQIAHSTLVSAISTRHLLVRCPMCLILDQVNLAGVDQTRTIGEILEPLRCLRCGKPPAWVTLRDIIPGIGKTSIAIWCGRNLGSPRPVRCEASGPVAGPNCGAPGRVMPTYPAPEYRALFCCPPLQAMHLRRRSLARRTQWGRADGVTLGLRFRCRPTQRRKFRTLIFP